MKKNAVPLCIMIISVVAVISLAPATKSYAGVDVNVGINIPLPMFVFPAPPEVIPIRESNVYYVPEVEVDVLFYHGHWYRPHRGRWYRASSYDGPWFYTAPKRIPRAVMSIPHDYRRHPPGHRRVHHRDLHKNWRKWEKEKYWHRASREHGRDRGLNREDRGRHRERDEYRGERRDRHAERDEHRGEGRGRGHR